MAFFVTAAVIGGGAGLASAVIGSNAASRAADVQAKSAQNALDFQNGVNSAVRAYREGVYADNQPRFATATNALGTAADAYGNAQTAAKANYQPYMDVGRGATYTLGQLTGASGSNPDYSSFFNSPDYNFAQQQGELGITRGANARGANLGGGVLKDLASFNSGLATQQYGNYFNRLMGLSQLGASAVNGFSSASTNNAGGLANVAGGFGNLATGAANSNNTASANIGNTTQAVGQATASGIVGGANAITGGVNSAANNTLLAGYLNRNPTAYGSGSGGVAGTTSYGGQSWPSFGA